MKTENMNCKNCRDEGLTRFLSVLLPFLLLSLPVFGVENSKVTKKEPLWNGFVGHYGYAIDYPPGFTSEAFFSDPEGKFEVVQFWPKGHCAEQDERGCAVKDGWFNLVVMPKDIIARYNKADTLDAFFAMVRKESESAGEQPVTVPVNNKRFKGRTLVLKRPNGPFSAMTYIEGKKVYYRFSYHKNNTLIKRVIASLAE